MYRNDSLIIIENKKPVETVYELKGDKKDFIKSPCRTSENSVYQIPSFEEFMKDYQVDEKLSYIDLEHSDVGDSKGYGPCSANNCPYSALPFQMRIRLNDYQFTRFNFPFVWWYQGDYEFTAINIEGARSVIKALEVGNMKVINYSLGQESTGTKTAKKEVIRVLNSAIERHENGEVINLTEEI